MNLTDKPFGRIPLDQWTNPDGEVLVVNIYGDRDPLAGWPWGLFLQFKDSDDWRYQRKRLWQVYGVKPSDIAEELESEVRCVKFRAGTLRYHGSWKKAMKFVLPGQIEWLKHGIENKTRRRMEVIHGGSVRQSFRWGEVAGGYTFGKRFYTAADNSIFFFTNTVWSHALSTTVGGEVGDV